MEKQQFLKYLIQFSATLILKRLWKRFCTYFVRTTHFHNSLEEIFYNILECELGDFVL